MMDANRIIMDQSRTGNVTHLCQGCQAGWPRAWHVFVALGLSYHDTIDGLEPGLVIPCTADRYTKKAV
jgi:hypothetical protein